ncbi:MAG: hypothetical protein OEM28_11840 [Nitrosopumilus sp.]|nr:hypothetical protein [Nitrosopumilus sp.]MDH3487144.1 hypothetical protein [Nitrosopumilus sp.]
MKDEIDSFVNDVKIYSNGLITALENKKHSESLDYIHEMKRCLKSIHEYLEMKKDIKSSKF